MDTFTVINTEKAPKPVGPYSQATNFKGIIFISGQIAIDPKTGKFIKNSIEDQTIQVLENLGAILESQNLYFKNIIKITIFTSNMDYFEVINKIYSKYFTINPPARSFIEVSKLPNNADVEIEAIAVS